MPEFALVCRGRGRSPFVGCLSPDPHVRGHVQAPARSPSSPGYSCPEKLLSTIDFFPMSEQTHIDILPPAHTQKHCTIRTGRQRRASRSQPGARPLSAPRFYSAKSQVKFGAFRFSRTLQFTVSSPSPPRQTRACGREGRNRRTRGESPEAFTFLLFLLL